MECVTFEVLQINDNEMGMNYEKNCNSKINKKKKQPDLVIKNYFSLHLFSEIYT